MKKILSNIASNLDFYHIQDHPKGYGCYSTFDLNSWITKLPNKKLVGDEIEWTRAFYLSKNNLVCIVMQYFWDGDGTLIFNLPNYGYCLHNGDCKKDHRWEWLVYADVMNEYREAAELP